MWCLDTRKLWQFLPPIRLHHSLYLSQQVRGARRYKRLQGAAGSRNGAHYTVRVVKAVTILSQAVKPIKVINAMGGFGAVEVKLDFRARHCCILMRDLIDLTPGSQTTLMVMKFTSQPLLLQGHMRGAVLADTPSGVVQLWRPSITAKEVHDVPEVSIAD